MDKNEIIFVLPTMEINMANAYKSMDKYEYKS